MCDFFFYGGCTNWVDFLMVGLIWFCILTVIGLIIFLIYMMFFKEYISEGRVVEKYYEPEHTWVQLMPIMIGKVISMIPIFHFDDEDWVIVVENNEGKVGHIYVSEKTYRRVRIGQWYSATPEDSLFDDIEEREATDEEIAESERE